MANPYKKAEQVQKKAPGSRQESAKVEEVKVAPVKVEEANPVEPEVKTTVAPVVENAPVADIFDGMVEQKPKAKSYGFYLDDEVVEALEKVAKQKKISKSKVLNTILRNVLIK